jgi:hypothetical protein
MQGRSTHEAAPGVSGGQRRDRPLGLPGGRIALHVEVVVHTSARAFVMGGTEQLYSLSRAGHCCTPTFTELQASEIHINS